MKHILSVLTFCLLAQISLATTYYSNPVGGNFNGAIWSTNVTGPFTTAGTSITTNDDVMVQGGTLVINVASPCRHITVQNGATATVNIAVTLSGDMTIQSGGVVQLGPIGSNTGSLTLQNLTVDNGGKIWGNDPVNSTAGNVKTIRINGSSLICNGTVGDGINNDALLLQPEGATITITGSGAIDVSRIRKGASTNGTTNLIIDADVNVRFGTTCIYNNQNTTAFNITVNASKTLKCISIVNPTGFSGTEGSISLNGTTGGSSRRQGLYTINGTLECEYLYLAATSTTGTDVFKYLVGGAGTIKVNSQIKGNSATGTTAATADLQLQSGATLKLMGNTPTSSIDGTSTKNKFIFDAASTVEYDGTSNQPIENNFGNYGNLKIAGTGIKVLAGTTTVNGLLSLNAGTLNTGANNLTLGISAFASLEAATVLNITGGKTDFASRPVALKSNAAGTASIGSITGDNVATGLIGATNVTMQTYIPGGRRAFRFISHPFTNTLSMASLIDNVYVTGAGSGFDVTGSNSPSAFWFDNTATVPGTWTAFASTADALWTRYRGIRILVRGNRYQPSSLTGGNPVSNPDTLDVTGTLNVGTATIGLPNASAYHFVGNPYPSPTDIGTVVDATANIGTQYWVWDANASTKGAYITKMVGSGTYSLAASAAFFVQPTASTSLVFNETNKTASATNNLFRSSNTISNLLELQLLYNNYPADNLFVVLNPLAKSSKDDHDGNKLSNSDMNFYTLSSDGKKLSLDTRPINNKEAIKLGFGTNVDAAYTIKVASYNLDSTMEVYLKDNYTHSLTKLNAMTEYSFIANADTASKGEGRFELVLKPVTVPVTLMPSSNIPVITVGPNPAQDFVNIAFSNEARAKTVITLIDALGRIVKTVDAGNVVNGQVRIDVKNMGKGIYYVKLHTGKSESIKKLLLD